MRMAGMLQGCCPPRITALRDRPCRRCRRRRCVHLLQPGESARLRRRVGAAPVVVRHDARHQRVQQVKVQDGLVHHRQRAPRNLAVVRGAGGCRCRARAALGPDLGRLARAVVGGLPVLQRGWRLRVSARLTGCASRGPGAQRGAWCRFVRPGAWFGAVPGGTRGVRNRGKQPDRRAERRARETMLGGRAPAPHREAERCWPALLRPAVRRRAPCAHTCRPHAPSSAH